MPDWLPASAATCRLHRSIAMQEKPGDESHIQANLSPSNETRLIRSPSLHTLHLPSLTLLTDRHEESACTHVLVPRLVEPLRLGSQLRSNFGLFSTRRSILLEDFALPKAVLASPSYTTHLSNHSRWFALAGRQSCPDMGHVLKAGWIPLPRQLAHSATTSACFLDILTYQDFDMWSATSSSSSLSILLSHCLHNSRCSHSFFLFIIVAFGLCALTCLF